MNKENQKEFQIIIEKNIIPMNILKRYCLIK